MERQIFNVRLDVEDLKQMAEIERLLKVSRADLVRQAIKEYLKTFEVGLEVRVVKRTIVEERVVERGKVGFGGESRDLG